MADEPTDEESKEEEDFGALTGGGDSESSEEADSESSEEADSESSEEADSDTFGMGSLPPLSDFDSTEGESSDSDLPPLDTPSDDDEGPISGLPPIVDIKVDTPAVRPSDLDTPTDRESGPDATPDTPAEMLNTPSPAGFATPSPDLDSPSGGGLGFQDFAADSDFSPETPEIGPGPDSDIETPMFDSAFGGDSDDFSTGGQSTPAPTQAMETPLFGSQPEAEGGGMGFDDDAFGAHTPDVAADAGTPVPDFSPDTGAGLATDTDMPLGGMQAPGKKRGLVGVLVNVVLLMVGVAIGIGISPFVGSMLPFLPDPSAEELQQKDAEIAQLQGQVRRLTTTDLDQNALTPEEVEKLLDDYKTAQANLNRAETQIEQRGQDLEELDNSILLVSADIEEKNNLFVEAQESLEDLTNETAITRARHEGLLAENERLSETVGELEIANARRQATKDALLHNIDLLTVQIQGGSPLSPQRYNHADRLARVTALHDKVARAKWADSQLLDEYTNLYLAELGIASSREYFFARIPVHDKLGNIRHRWAECLMNGNWSVYFRTIDGQTIGSYENAAGSGPPRYEFREDLSGGMRSDIFDAIKASRVEDYKEKIAVLEQKQKIYETQTKVQTSFTSL